MNKSVLTIAAIAALAMPQTGMASALPRIGPEPTETQMQAAIQDLLDTLAAEYQNMSKKCQNPVTAHDAADCMFATFGKEASRQIKIAGFQKVACKPARVGYYCQYRILLDLGILDVGGTNRVATNVKRFVKTPQGWQAYDS
jgi:hypothetical protein